MSEAIFAVVTIPGIVAFKNAAGIWKYDENEFGEYRHWVKFHTENHSTIYIIEDHNKLWTVGETLDNLTISSLVFRQQDQQWWVNLALNGSSMMSRPTHELVGAKRTDGYTYKGEKYTYLYEGKMKIGQVWLPCIVYQAQKDNIIYVREINDFEEKFR